MQIEIINCIKDWLRVLSLASQANSWEELSELSGYPVEVLKMTSTVCAPSYRFPWDKQK